MIEMLKQAKAAKAEVSVLTTAQKNAALEAMAAALLHHEADILAANAQDLEAASGTISKVMLDRLMLNSARIAGMAQGILDVAKLPDPVRLKLDEHIRADGLRIQKVSVPMGVIAIIYESRPNVTSDAAALALKSGNVCVLRGGKEAFRSANAIVNALREGLKSVGITENAINLVQDTSRASSTQLMTANGYIDLLIPRGGAGLINACVQNATVPCIATGTGICHVYVEKSADQEMALRIVENAKTSRPSVCLSFTGALAAGWNCGWTKPPSPSSPAPPREGRTSTPNSWTIFWQSSVWKMYRKPLPTFPRTPPATAKPSSPGMKQPRLLSPPVWTVRQSISTPPPGSPTAVNSVLVARWASPPRNSTPVAPWACGS